MFAAPVPSCGPGQALGTWGSLGEPQTLEHELFTGLATEGGLWWHLSHVWGRSVVAELEGNARHAMVCCAVGKQMLRCKWNLAGKAITGHAYPHNILYHICKAQLIQII